MYADISSIEKARKADLHAFLLSEHPSLFIREGRSIRMRSNMSISIKEGFHGYRDFATGEHGNSITFLTEHLGYNFQDAVAALCGIMSSGIQTSSYRGNTFPSKGIDLPDEAPQPHRRMYAFLASRGIPYETIGWLAAGGLIYQSAETNNVVFVNKERDYCELRGTYTYAERPFHGCRKSRANRFWYFVPGPGIPLTAFITEAALDAISLFLLHRRSGQNTSASVYISIGGVDNHPAIDRIKSRIRTILAVDNDSAGDLCRKRHHEIEHMIPTLKDWNEDLMALSQKSGPKT